MHMIRQAIQTKWLAPTNHRPARVTAWCDAGRITITQNDNYPNETHRIAAEKLAAQYDWRGVWFQGALPNNSGQVFVCVPTRPGDDTSPAFSR